MAWGGGGQYNQDKLNTGRNIHALMWISAPPWIFKSHVKSAPRASAYCVLTSEHTLPFCTKTNAHLHAKGRAGEEMESDSSMETGANHEEICQQV